MYCQITTTCNMTCAHCCFSATRKGAHMDSYTFLKALDLAVSMGDYVTIGGGEPTCHPKFFEFLDKALEYRHRGKLDMAPLVVTNGKLVGKARKLIEYVEREAPLHVELSQDEYHDPISPEIVRAFQGFERQRKERSRYGHSGSVADGSAGIRTVKGIIPVGRAAEPARGIVTVSDVKCACEDLLVDPHGNIFSCGCKTHLLGNVFESDEVLSDLFSDLDRDQLHAGGGLPAREVARLPAPLVLAA